MSLLPFNYPTSDCVNENILCSNSYCLLFSLADLPMNWFNRNCLGGKLIADIHPALWINKLAPRFRCVRKWLLSFDLHSSAARLQSSARSAATKRAPRPTTSPTSPTAFIPLDHLTPSTSSTRTRATACRKVRFDDFDTRIPCSPEHFFSQWIFFGFPKPMKSVHVFCNLIRIILSNEVMS